MSMKRFIRQQLRIAGVNDRRWTSTTRSSNASAKKSLNLTHFASPLLLRLHPDTLQRHSIAHAQRNEQAMKQLNAFLELAACGCNNDAYRARKHVLALADAQHNDPYAPIRFPLQFQILKTQQDKPETIITPSETSFHAVEYVMEVPGMLIRRTLANSARSSSATRTLDPSSALQTPFAREWQRTTKRILKDLFHLAEIPLIVEKDDGTSVMTPLAQWLAEEDTLEMQHGVHATTHNRQQYIENVNFDKLFYQMLTREKNIVHVATTGLEDGPTAQHAVLTNLLTNRVFLPKLDDKEQKRQVFFWLANFLLLHFMELRLHSLVWNKITLAVTIDTSEDKQGQVLWDEEKPQDGMGVLIPFGMDAAELVDFLYEHIEEFGFALASKGKTKPTHDQQTNRRDNYNSKQNTNRSTPEQKGRRSRRRKHFYEAEVAAMFRKS